MVNDPPNPAPTSPPPGRTEAPPRVSSRELLGKKGEIIIQHGDREYRLRVTQSGKLILTA